MKPTRTRRLRRTLLAVVGLLLLCLAVINWPVLGSRAAVAGPGALDRLDPIDKARLAEALQLKQLMGESVWPGWGAADIPVMLWNQDLSFLVGYPEPPDGWTFVAGDHVQGQPYYAHPARGLRNFVVRVGDRWVASLAAGQQSSSALLSRLRALLPPFVARLLPGAGTTEPAEAEIARVLHQSFHVYQVEMAGPRLPAVYRALLEEDRYWSAAPAMDEAWAHEIVLLGRAVKSSSDEEAAEWARRFLAWRAERRRTAGLDPALIDYERQIEWLDGLPKYVALDTWRYAFGASDYQPLAAMAQDPDFEGYATFDRYWDGELAELERQADRPGPTRLYYTGMAEAILLDWLSPDWKTRALSAPEQPALEDLLAEAVAGR